MLWLHQFTSVAVRDNFTFFCSCSLSWYDGDVSLFLGDFDGVGTWPAVQHALVALIAKVFQGLRLSGEYIPSFTAPSGDSCSSSRVSSEADVVVFTIQLV